VACQSLPPVDARVAAIARRQHGLITSAQARAAGLSTMQIVGRHRSGRWVDIEPGLWLIAGTSFSWHTRLMAACLMTGGVASHRAAAVLHGADGVRPGRPEVTVARARQSRRPGLTAHRSSDLDPADRISIDGIPTTTAARLGVDLGAVVSYAVYERAVDDLLARRRLSWIDLADTVVRVGRRGRRGVAAARRLLLERDAEDLTESRLERLFLRLIRTFGLPEPEPQHVVRDGTAFVARVDFAWPARRVAVELDGRRYHAGAEAFASDRWKRNRLQVLGWDVLAYTWTHVLSEGPAVTAQVAAALERGAIRCA
jgi:hypothetical protein